MRFERCQWNEHAFHIFRKYMNFETVLNITNLPLMCVLDADEIPVGYFTYAKGKTFDGKIMVEIRHMAGSFDPAMLYNDLQNWSDEEQAAIRVVSDRAGFDKICKDNGFQKISTIWELV